ncbi:MAG: lipid kinase YegS [Elusimicrobia bacterium]|nr:lipid kinase YegS [Elusimicrobiota bacterium]
MKDFFHILNPNQDHAKGVRRFFRKNLQLQSMWVERTSHPTHLETLVLWAVNEGHPNIAIWGGDGSLSRVVQCLYELKALEKVTLALVPAGTCNDFGRKMGLALWKKLVHNFLEAPGRHELVDVGLLKSEIGNRTFINNAGFGRTAHRARYKSHPIRDIYSFSTKRLDINWTLNGSDSYETRDAFLGVVCNGPFFNGGLNFEKDVDPSDGILNGFFEAPQPPRSLVWKFIKGRFGHPLFNHNSFRVDGPFIRVGSDEDLFPQVDGEPVGEGSARNLEFSILPQKLKFHHFGR